MVWSVGTLVGIFMPGTIQVEVCCPPWSDHRNGERTWEHESFYATRSHTVAPDSNVTWESRGIDILEDIWGCQLVIVHQRVVDDLMC